MATLNYWKLVLEPLGKQLREDPVFQGIKIFYDRSQDKVVTADICPAINYFVEGGWSDRARGERASSLQVRTGIIPVGFGVWYFDMSADRLDEALFEMSGTLQDWLRDHTRFDEKNCVDVLGMLPGLPDYNGDENGMLGSHKIVAEFQVHRW